jgi:hypothetical protein
LDEAISPRIKEATSGDKSVLSTFRSIFQGRPHKKRNFNIFDLAGPLQNASKCEFVHAYMSTFVILLCFSVTGFYFHFSSVSVFSSLRMNSDCIVIGRFASHLMELHLV